MINCEPWNDGFVTLGNLELTCACELQELKNHFEFTISNEVNSAWMAALSGYELSRLFYGLEQLADVVLPGETIQCVWHLRVRRYLAILHCLP